MGIHWTIQDVGGQILRGCNPRDSASETVERGGRLPPGSDRRYRVVSIHQPCPSRFLPICGLLFFEGFIDEDGQPGADVDVPLAAEALEAFPPGITVEGATPQNEGRKGVQRLGHLSTRSWRTSGKNEGVAPSTFSPSCAAPRRTVRGGAGAALCFTAEDSGNPCQPASNAGFRAQPGPRRRGLRPLREERWSGQKREPLGAPPV